MAPISELFCSLVCWDKCEKLKNRQTQHLGTLCPWQMIRQGWMIQLINQSVMLPFVSFMLCCVGTDTGCILTRPELSIEQRRRRDRQTPRIAMRKCPHSSFICLSNSGNNQASLNCCGMDHKIFNNLLEIFEPMFNTHIPDSKTGVCCKLKTTAAGKTTGQPREIDATGCLGLVLFWFRT